MELKFYLKIKNANSGGDNSITNQNVELEMEGRVTILNNAVRKTLLEKEHLRKQRKMISQ